METFNVRILQVIAMTVLIVGVWAPRDAYASDGTITINGQITANTCTVNAGTPDLAVTLPTVSTSALPAGAVAGATSVTMNYSACSSTPTTATVYFEASANIDPATGCLKNTVATGGSNVEVCFLNSDGTAINMSKPTTSQGVEGAALASGSGTNTFLVEYSAHTAAATAGAYTSLVTYSVVYQ